MWWLWYVKLLSWVSDFIVRVYSFTLASLSLNADAFSFMIIISCFACSRSCLFFIDAIAAEYLSVSASFNAYCCLRWAFPSFISWVGAIFLLRDGDFERHWASFWMLSAVSSSWVRGLRMSKVMVCPFEHWSTSLSSVLETQRVSPLDDECMSRSKKP